MKTNTTKKAIRIQTHTLSTGCTVEVSTANTPQGRVARIAPGTPGQYVVPAELCALGAGKDAWLRNIEFPCNDCGGWHKASELYGSSDLPGSCSACAEKFFKCDKCGGHHHPDDPCPAPAPAPAPAPVVTVATEVQVIKLLPENYENLLHALAQLSHVSAYLEALRMEQGQDTTKPMAHLADATVAITAVMAKLRNPSQK